MSQLPCHSPVAFNHSLRAALKTLLKSVEYEVISHLKLWKFVSPISIFAKRHGEPLQFITAVNRTQPIKLRATPVCGELSSKSFTEVNTGVQLNATKTIVAFGDSWTSNGSNVFPPNPSAGARPGNNFRARASNGYYSVGGAVVDLSAWNSTNKGVTYTSDNLLRTDFVAETSLFLQQGHFLADLDPDTTLYTVQFGINDNNQYLVYSGIYHVSRQAVTGTKPRALPDYLVAPTQYPSSKWSKKLLNPLGEYVYFQANVTTVFQNVVQQGLQAAHAENGTNFATVNLANLFTAIDSSMEEWGYTNTTCLASQNFTYFGCDDLIVPYSTYRVILPQL
ncbi:hypothetical protein B0H10DRAFT_2367116 [Mycena sp. CBHHK59/15]|nr:hypothetical protein B0H10DRAFT_2367116 [Mycena sp. CBHHK59/15]